MPKQQMGLRIDRVLYKQFQQLCALEKLRPGEAVESLIRVAVDAKSIIGVHLEDSERENTVRVFDDALFRSRLARLKKSLELEERYLKETGELPRRIRIRILRNRAHPAGKKISQQRTRTGTRSMPVHRRQTIRRSSKEQDRKRDQLTPQR